MNLFLTHSTTKSASFSPASPTKSANAVPKGNNLCCWKRKKVDKVLKLTDQKDSCQNCEECPQPLMTLHLEIVAWGSSSCQKHPNLLSETIVDLHHITLRLETIEFSLWIHWIVGKDQESKKKVESEHRKAVVLTLIERSNGISLGTTSSSLWW